MPHSGHRATLLPCPGHRGQKAQLPDPVPVSAQLSALPQPLVEPGDRGPGGSQILPPLVPPASSAALLGSAAAGPARAALAVVPVQLLVVLTANDPCGQHTVRPKPDPAEASLCTTAWTPGAGTDASRGSQWPRASTPHTPGQAGTGLGEGPGPPGPAVP